MAHEQHPTRPPIHSQHSNSVPSTPFQQPRDLRFHSRSPSPHRGLSNNSPRSVVSEAVVGHGTSQRLQPTICKFETGAEIRKRRIPYVEGGNEELEPPRKEPKRSLEPEEHESLRTQMDDLYQRLLPSDESEARRAQLVKKLERLLNEEWPDNDIRVNVFGSSGNLLSSSDSDVDICITTTLKKLQSMHSIAMLLHKNGMEKVVCRASAKVPIVKCWDPELNLAADLNVNNPLALENTRMIKTYVQMDPRVRPLAKIIKYWTKRRILNDAAFGGTISSYTWICMIISFLQRRDPPILPSLQKKAEERKHCDNGDAPIFADNLEDLKSFGDANKETLPELLFQFFRHYGYEFEYSKYVVSVKEGRLLSRKEKGWDPTNYADKEARNRLCVEEPFTLIRNLGNSADDYAWSGIHGEIRRAFDLLADGCQLEKCCEQYEFPPEEKPIFQRPEPRPKPTLTRSASQSGRSSHESGSGRSRKSSNRNQSSQRSGTRRASSGASFGNQRVPYHPTPQTNPVMDYFGLKGAVHEDLHSYLYRQWQQIEALKSQLAAQHHQSQAASSGQMRSGDPVGSPHHRAYQPNGMPSPRFLDNPPHTALPAFHTANYPRYYPSPTMSQARTRESGTSTNPSSPSLVPAVPAFRRQVHRGSIPDSSASSSRSQSQPPQSQLGRSYQHPLATQLQHHPGFDISAAQMGQYQSLRSSSGPRTSVPPGMQMSFSPTSIPSYPSSVSTENSMPKEYVGYYVGQSPLLSAQYASNAQMQMQMQMPPMTLRDPPPQRQRRVTPDLQPPMPNGRHSSRSPSPLGHLRSYTTTGDLRSTTVQGLQSPPVRSDIPVEPATAPLPVAKPAANAGPLIVNGSGMTASSSAQPEKTNGFASPSHPLYDDGFAPLHGTGLRRVQTLPIRPLDTDIPPEQASGSPRISPSPRLKSGAPKLALSPNGTPKGPNGTTEPFHEPIPAPLLSPVAELRTPSPTRPTSFERERPSPSTNGFVKAAKLANARQAAPQSRENEPLIALPATAIKHERKGSAPNPSSAAKPAKSPTGLTPPASAGNAAPTQPQGQNAATNQWQQATRKGHKKSKSGVVGQQNGTGSKGQAMPVNEAERKGG